MTASKLQNEMFTIIMNVKHDSIVSSSQDELLDTSRGGRSTVKRKNLQHSARSSWPLSCDLVVVVSPFISLSDQRGLDNNTNAVQGFPLKLDEIFPSSFRMPANFCCWPNKTKQTVIMLNDIVS